MSIRGELFTTQVTLENRSYFFNVKENRAGDVFMQIVESKSRDGSDFDRHQIAVFAEDLQKFLQGMDKSLQFIDKDRKERAKAKAAKKAAIEARFSAGSSSDKKKVYRRRNNNDAEPKKDDGIKRTGRVIHVVSKINSED